MKTKLLLIAVIGFFLIGCSNKDDKADSLDGKFVIDLSAFVPVTPKSIYSQEPTNRVNKVMLYAYKLEGGSYNLEREYEISDWARGTTFKRYEVPDGQQPSEGTFIFLAVGEEEGSQYAFDQKERLSEFRAILERKVGATEFFAGASDPVYVSTTGVRVALEMKRKVAGIMGYFSNVPEDMFGKRVAFLRLVTNRLSIVENIAAGTGEKPDDNENVILEFDLTRQNVHPTLKVYTGNDVSAARASKVENSQLGGAYLLPIDKMELTLRLTDKDGNLIKDWPVLFKGERAIQLNPNFLYSLGTKPTINSTAGDAPIDLMKTYVLALTLNPNWDGFGDLTLKD